MLENDFEKILLEIVDEGLSSLGKSSAQAIYFHLEKGFGIKREEIPYKVRDFKLAIEKIFGLGANFLEILIMKRLYERIGRDLKLYGSRDLTFTKYVAAAKRNFLRKRAEELTHSDQVVPRIH